VPFTEQQFFEVMARYNQAVWPAQLALNAMAIAILVLASRGLQTSRWISALLALLWVWTAIAYHATFFRQINPAAVVFAIFFIAEAGLLVWYGVIGGRLIFLLRGSAWHVVGTALIAYALVIYPLLGLAFGQRYPEMPTFGLPCPTVIFTLGLLMWSRPTAPFVVWVVPFMWALLGMQAAVLFGVREDYGLTVAGALAVLYWYARWQTTQARPKPRSSSA